MDGYVFTIERSPGGVKGIEVDIVNVRNKPIGTAVVKMGLTPAHGAYNPLVMGLPSTDIAPAPNKRVCTIMVDMDSHPLEQYDLWVLVGDNPEEFPHRVCRVNIVD